MPKRTIEVTGSDIGYREHHGHNMKIVFDLYEFDIPGQYGFGYVQVFDTSTGGRNELVHIDLDADSYASFREAFQTRV